MPKTCYVITAWGGPRRAPDHAEMKKDGALYLREHVYRAAALCERIDRIVVACPHGSAFYPGYEAYVDKLEAEGKVLDVTVEIFRRKNVGMSYGALSDVYGKYRTTFDYYIVAEDDYLPAMKDLDTILMGMIESAPRCGFLCGLIWTANGKIAPHAGIFLGIIRSQALEKVWLRNGSLCKFTENNYSEAEVSGQVGLSQAIVDAGFPLLDWLKTNKSVFFEAKGVTTFGNAKNKAFFLPAQSADFLTKRFKLS